jgi:hypothetical protein
VIERHGQGWVFAWIVEDSKAMREKSVVQSWDQRRQMSTVVLLVSE